MRSIVSLSLLFLAGCSTSNLTPNLSTGDAGDRAIIGGVPYDGVDVLQLENSSNDSFCGGVHVGGNWVLTAAHCVHGAENTELYVDGMWVDDVVVHPDYVSDGTNDMALVHTRTEAVAVDLSTQIGLNEATDLLVAGYGRTELNGEGSDVLLSADVWTETWSCDAGDDQFCTSAAVCIGDDGGPVVGTVDGRSTVVGIISRSRLCGDDDGTAIHSSVPYFLDWVRETVPSVSDWGDDHGSGWAGTNFEEQGEHLLEGRLFTNDTDSFNFYWHGLGDFSMDYVSDEPLIVQLKNTEGDSIEPYEMDGEGWYRIDVTGVWGTEITDYLIEVEADDHSDDDWGATWLELGYSESSFIHAGDMDIFRFSVEPGTYVVTSEENADMYGILASDDGTIAMEDDDSGAGTSFRMEFTVDVATDFTLTARGYNEFTEGVYYIGLNEVVE